MKIYDKSMTRLSIKREDVSSISPESGGSVIYLRNGESVEVINRFDKNITETFKIGIGDIKETHKFESLRKILWT